MGNVRPFLHADLWEARACGILRCPAPLTIVDPELENTAVACDHALKLAMTIAPAITAHLQTHTRLPPRCILVVMCPGLDVLGTKVAEEMQVKLRAPIHAVHRIAQELGLYPCPKPFAQNHIAESAEILGERWYNKACHSDREAMGLISPLRSDPNRRRCVATWAVAA